MYMYSLLWKPPKSKKIVVPLQVLAWLLLACYISNFSIKIAPPPTHTTMGSNILWSFTYFLFIHLFFHEIVYNYKLKYEKYFMKSWELKNSSIILQKDSGPIMDNPTHTRLHCATLSFQLSASKKFLLSFCSVKGPRSHIAPCRYGSTLED